MLDLAEARAALDAAKIGNAQSVPVSPSWITQATDELGTASVAVPIGWLQLAIDELEAGRTAQAREGQVFGLPLGQRL